MIENKQVPKGYENIEACEEDVNALEKLSPRKLTRRGTLSFMTKKTSQKKENNVKEVQTQFVGFIKKQMALAKTSKRVKGSSSKQQAILYLAINRVIRCIEQKQGLNGKPLAKKEKSKKYDLSPLCSSLVLMRCKLAQNSEISDYFATVGADIALDDLDGFLDGVCRVTEDDSEEKKAEKNLAATRLKFTQMTLEIAQADTENNPNELLSCVEVRLKSNQIAEKSKGEKAGRDVLAFIARCLGRIDAYKADNSAPVDQLTKKKTLRKQRVQDVKELQDIIATFILRLVGINKTVDSNAELFSPGVRGYLSTYKTRLSHLSRAISADKLALEKAMPSALFSFESLAGLSNKKLPAFDENMKIYKQVIGKFSANIILLTNVRMFLLQEKQENSTSKDIGKIDKVISEVEKHCGAIFSIIKKSEQLTKWLAPFLYSFELTFGKIENCQDVVSWGVDPSVSKSHDEMLQELEEIIYQEKEEKVTSFKEEKQSDGAPDSSVLTASSSSSDMLKAMGGGGDASGSADVSRELEGDNQASSDKNIAIQGVSSDVEQVDALDVSLEEASEDLSAQDAQYYFLKDGKQMDATCSADELVKLSSRDGITDIWCAGWDSWVSVGVVRQYFTENSNDLMLGVEETYQALLAMKLEQESGQGSESESASLSMN